MTWPTVALGEVCDINVGRTPARANAAFWGEGEPWLSIADMNQGRVIRSTKEQITPLGAIGGRRVTPGTTLVSFKLSIGKVGIAGVPLFTNEAIAALPIKRTDLLLPDYLVRALEALDLSAGSNRAAMGATLNKAKLRQIQIPLPSLNEQRRLTSILAQADALRAKRRQVTARFDELIMSIFLDMFGDPRGWGSHFPMVTIGDLAESVQYGTSAKASIKGAWRILRMGNVTYGGRLDLRDLKYVDLSDTDIPKYTVRRGDLLFNRTNSVDKVGKTAVVDTDEPFAIAGYLIRVRMKRENSSAFVSGYLNSRHGKAVLRGMAKAIVNQANINASEMRSIPIARPPSKLQFVYEQRVGSVNRQRDSVLHAEMIDQRLFAALQSQAFSEKL